MNNNPSPITALLIEDDPAYADYLLEHLSSVENPKIEVVSSDRLSTGLSRLAQGGIDIVLLDLSLPDSQGLETIVKVRKHSSEIPIVVLTGLEDEGLAFQAICGGTQDYLVKGKLDSNVLVRTILYALERHQLLIELERARQQEQEARELHLSDLFLLSPQTPVTAQSFGSQPLSESLPLRFQELTQFYSNLLDLALERRVYKVEYNISGQLRVLAEHLGFLRASPRDVVEIHTAALKDKIHGESSTKVQVYLEEGRLMVLELMGHLVSFYRNYSLGAKRTSTSPESPKEER